MSRLVRQRFRKVRFFDTENSLSSIKGAVLIAGYSNDDLGVWRDATCQ